MDITNKKIIPIEVRDEYMLGSGVSIGARGSYNSVILRVKFDEKWQGLNKYATWTDALGNDVDQTLVTALDLVDGEPDTYDISVPSSVTMHAGTVKLSFTGYVVSGDSNKTVESLINTATGSFRVQESNATLLDDGSVNATLAQELYATMNDTVERLKEVEEGEAERNRLYGVAEDARDSEFNTKQDERRDAFTEEQTTRRDAFTEEQTTRRDAFTEEQTTRRDAFTKEQNDRASAWNTEYASREAQLKNFVNGLGIAQAPGDSESQVMSQKGATDLAKMITKCVDNTYSPNASEENGYVYPSNNGYITLSGDYKANDNWRTTDYIPVNESTTIKSKAGIYGNKDTVPTVTFYGEDKNFLSYIKNDGTNGNYHTIDTTPPEGAKYVRLTFVNSVPNDWIRVTTWVRAVTEDNLAHESGDSKEKVMSQYGATKLVNDVVPTVATRNLANLTFGNAYFGSGEYKPLANGIKDAASPDYVAVKGGTSYKLSCDVMPIDIKPRIGIYMYDENKTWISGKDQYINIWGLFHEGHVIKTHADCRYIRVAFSAMNSNTVAWQDIIPSRFQIEEEYRTGYVPPIAIDSSRTNTPSVAQSGYAAYGLPILEFKGDMSNISKENEVQVDCWYKYEKYNETTGLYDTILKNETCRLKWQGSGSLQYPKKNYTVKFDTKFEAKEGWDEQKKYCLKANYMDFSHSRNICSAKLWGGMVKSRTLTEENEELLENLNALPNGGAIDGFPICVVINGEYQGLYTFNIPKDKWMFGMGNGTQEAILCANAGDTGVAACKFRAEATVTEEDFEIEYVTGEDEEENDTSWINESLNNLIRACMSCDSKEKFENNVAPLLDVDSAMDYFIFTLISQNLDGIIRNYLLSTYDGTKWFFTAYDCDTTFGLYFGANSIMPNDGDGVGYKPCSVDDVKEHRVFELITKYRADELKARYESLVEGYTEEWGNALTENRFIDTFYNFIGKIPKALYDEEVKLWPTIPLTSVNNVSQIIDHYRRRRAFIDPQLGLGVSTEVKDYIDEYINSALGGDY